MSEPEPADRRSGLPGPGDASAPGSHGGQVAGASPPPDSGPSTGHPAARHHPGLSRLSHLVLSDDQSNAPAADPPDTPPATSTLLPPHNHWLTRSPFSIGFMATVGALTAWVVLQTLSQVRDVVVMIVLALFIALGVNPIVDWLTRLHLRRAVGVVIVAVGLIGIVALAIVTEAPILTKQVNLLIQNAPNYLDQINRNPQLARLDARYGIVAKITAFLSSGSLMQNLFGGLLGAGKILANVVFTVIVVLVLTLWFLGSLPAIKQMIYRLAPASNRARVRLLADEVFTGVGNYLTGVFVIATCAATFAFIFMSIAGLGQYALALTLLVGIFFFIPMIGSSLSLVTVSLVGFAIRPAIGIAAIIYFLCYMVVDAYVVYPTVMRRAVKMPGALVVVAALFGGTLLGVIGALIAIPTAVTLMLLYRRVLIPHLDSQ